MAESRLDLLHGVTIGEQTYNSVTLKELTPGDIIEAGLESERSVMTESGYQLLTSNTLMGVNCLLRSIKKIGDSDITVTRTMLDKFHIEDYERMLMVTDAFDQALINELNARGEASTSGEGSGTPGD